MNYYNVFLKVILIPILLIFIAGCNSCNSSGSIRKRDSDTIVHYNVIVAPDVSNRIRPDLHPKSVTDQAIIRTIFENINKLLFQGRNTYQYDIYRLNLINKNLISYYQIDADKLEINFSNFQGNQLKRVDFISGKNKKDNLEKSTSILLKEVDKIYDQALLHNYGADVWSYLNTGYNKSLLGGELETNDSKRNNKEFVNRYRNILILITDGYIETGNENSTECTGNKCHYLTSRTVKKFRDDYKAHGNNSDLKSFFIDQEYGILPVKNDALKETEVLVLEFFDRSLTRAGNATVHPSDSEILKLFWEDWIERSNVKRKKIYSVAESKEDVRKSILDFINNK